MSLLRCDAGGDEKEVWPRLHVGHWEAPRTDAGLGGWSSSLSYGIRGWGSVEGEMAAVSTNPRSGFRRPRSSLLTQHCLPIEEGRKARVALRVGM